MSEDFSVPEAEFRRANRTIRRSFVRGVALTIPLIVTLLVFGFAVRSISRVVGPVVEGVTYLIGTRQLPEFVLELFALVLLFWFIFAVGFIAERRAEDSARLGDTIDTLISDIPGFGSVYTGVRQLSEVMLQEDTESFREVKLLEFPGDGTYMLCYVTATPPETVAAAVGGDEQLTLFVPLAPNPVMGGFLVHAPADRVHDIDMTVEESMRAIITSGVAVDPTVSDSGEVSTPVNVGTEMGSDPDTEER